jgi:HD-GYP domain-containing protein (c-di-GMP phosphodiesterase class II)
MKNSEGLCRAIREEGLIIRLLDGELPPTEEHKVLTHLRTCHECLGLTADLLYTDERLKLMFARQEERQDQIQKKKPGTRFLLEVDKLPIGKEVDRDLLDEEGTLLIAAGTELTQQIIDRLKSRGIEKLAIEPTDVGSEDTQEQIEAPWADLKQLETYLEESGPEPVVSQFVRHQCFKTLEDSFKSLEEDGILDLGKVHEGAQQVTEEVLSRPQLTMTLADLILVDPSLHAHATNVLILFLMIARAIGHPAQLIRDHATGALLHDVGRIVLRRTSTVSGIAKSTKNEDLEHTEAGYSYLWNLGGINESALKMVMNHHERYDGSGYPRGLKGTMLSDWDQILILANTYDNLTWNRETGIRSGFHKALQVLIQDGSKYVRKGVIRAVVQTLGHYPPGTWVRMNNGEIGLVTRAHPGSPLKPQISLIYDQSGRRHSRPRFIDLTHNQNAYITGSVQVRTTA